MKNTPKRIVAFHLLNDYSGSPNILRQLIESWVAAGWDTHLYTSFYRDGFLTDIKGVKFHKGWYRFKSNPLLRLLYFMASQIWLCIKMFRKVKKTDIVYINTILPFGAAILGKIKGAHVIYHIHESTMNPPVLKWFLLWMVRRTASEVINVSRFVEASHRISKVPNHLVYNGLNDRFLSEVIRKPISRTPHNVLMVCSLKAYKGIFEFLQLAEDHPTLHFRLVMNATMEEIHAFLIGYEPRENMSIFSAQTDLHPFYYWADVVVNLSRPDVWIETFGLTIVEGMAYGLPSIVPPVGGILEVVEAGQTGLAVDSRNRELLNNALQSILHSTEQYQKMAQCAKERVKMFTSERMKQQLIGVLERVALNGTAC